MEHKETAQSAEEYRPAEEEGFRGRLSEAARKGFEALRKGRGRVGNVAGDAAKLARLRMEIFGLERVRRKIHREEGEKLWRLHREHKLGDLEEVFSEEIKRDEDLEAELETKKKELEAIAP